MGFKKYNEFSRTVEYRGEPMFLPRGQSIDPRRLEEIKSKALLERINTEVLLEMTNEIEAQRFELEGNRNKIDNMLDDNNSLSKKLKAYEKKYGVLKVCNSSDCNGGNVHKYGSTYSCDTCNGFGFKFEGTKEEEIYQAIDVASEGSKDNTCVVTFKKNEDGIIEVIDTKILKPKKK